MPRLRDHVRALRSRPPAAPNLLPGCRSTPCCPPRAGGARRRSRRSCASAAGGCEVRGDDGLRREGLPQGDRQPAVPPLADRAAARAWRSARWYGWSGNRLLVAGADNAFCNTRPAVRRGKLGPRVDSADLPRFCVRLDDFQARFLRHPASRSLQRHGHRRRPGRADPAAPTSRSNYAAAARRRERLPARPRVRPGDPLHRPVRQQPDQRRRRSCHRRRRPDQRGRWRPSRTPTSTRRTGQRAPDQQMAFAGIYLPTAPPTRRRSSARCTRPSATRR